MLLAACGTAQSVRPLGAGRSAVDLSVGGPMIAPAYDVPAPLLLLGYRRGLGDRSDVFGRLHLVPAVTGVFGVEAGASRLFLQGRGYVPAVSASAQLLFFTGPGGSFAVPACSVNASWVTGRWLLYAGTEQGVSWGQMLDRDGAMLHWSPYVGVTRDVGRWTYGLELRWWEPQTGSDVLVWWQGIGGRGALAPMFSVARRFGGEP